MAFTTLQMRTAQSPTNWPGPFIYHQRKRTFPSTSRLEQSWVLRQLPQKVDCLLVWVKTNSTAH